EDPVADLVERIQRDLDDVERIDGSQRARAWRRYARALPTRHGAELRRRAGLGLIREGHGDLRAEHVVLDPLAIVDRLEFDVALRRTDVADDLAFLTMDLERLGA